MKRDDPRFDPDFWRMYFKNFDEKRGMTPARTWKSHELG